MTYRYVLRVRSLTNGERITVEAWPNRKELATPTELRKPSFVIGSLSGPRTILVRYLVNEFVKKYGAERTKKGMIIRFPDRSIEAIIDAYRLGLLLASLSNAETDDEAECILRYVEKCTPEEVWFWTSKYLGFIRRSARPERVIKALTILAK
jgi:hypothetical protein